MVDLIISTVMCFGDWNLHMVVSRALKEYEEHRDDQKLIETVKDITSRIIITERSNIVLGSMLGLTVHDDDDGNTETIETAKASMAAEVVRLEKEKMMQNIKKQASADQPAPANFSIQADEHRDSEVMPIEPEKSSLLPEGEATDHKKSLNITKQHDKLLNALMKGVENKVE